jgi:hypothetical protein
MRAKQESPQTDHTLQKDPDSTQQNPLGVGLALADGGFRPPPNNLIVKG